MRLQFKLLSVLWNTAEWSYQWHRLLLVLVPPCSEDTSQSPQCAWSDAWLHHHLWHNFLNQEGCTWSKRSERQHWLKNKQKTKHKAQCLKPLENIKVNKKQRMNWGTTCFLCVRVHYFSCRQIISLIFLKMISLWLRTFVGTWRLESR